MQYQNVKFIFLASSYCQLDSIIVHDGKNAGAPVLIRICGRKTRAEFLSSGNQMFVIFTSDPSSEFRGFRAGFLEGINFNFVDWEVVRSRQT